jgi:NAD(P)-dependent dehydrogenase (short-subunit alcohol dehydrogenase family)
MSEQKTMSEQGPMREQQIALVTGANKGLGFAAARELARRGMTVIVGARDAGRGEAAAEAIRAEGGDAVHVPLDVTDPDSVAAAASTVKERYGRLDVLVNNAGILLERGEKPSDLPLDVIRRTYETNVLGVVAVTQAMLPLLAPTARIVNVSSGLGSLTRTTEPDSDYAKYPLLAYNSAKSALNAVTVSFANELRGTGIRVNAVCPGYCATDLNGQSGPRSVDQGKAVIVKLATDEDGPTAAFFDDDGPVPW